MAVQALLIYDIFNVALKFSYINAVPLANRLLGLKEDCSHLKPVRDDHKEIPSGFFDRVTC